MATFEMFMITCTLWASINLRTKLAKIVPVIVHYLCSEPDLACKLQVLRRNGCLRLSSNTQSSQSRWSKVPCQQIAILSSC